MACSASSSAPRSAWSTRRQRTAIASQRVAGSKGPSASSCRCIGQSRCSSSPWASRTSNSISRARPKRNAAASRACQSPSPRTGASAGAAGAHAHRKRARRFGLRQRAIGQRQRGRRAARLRQLGAADGQVGLAVHRGQRGTQRVQQRAGALLGHARRRQVQREIGAVQPAGQRTLHMPRVGLQHLRQRGQQPVGGFVADAPVHRLQLAQPHQQQAGAAVVLGAQRAVQLRHEMTALRQPGHGIGMGLLAHRLQAWPPGARTRPAAAAPASSCCASADAARARAARRQ